jgi:hypothetical protein
MNRIVWVYSSVLPRVVFWLGLAILPSRPAAALGQPRIPFAQDNHAFRYILQERGLMPQPDWNRLKDSPDRSVLIVFGETQKLEQIDSSAFVNAGGAVLVATDRSTGDLFDKQFGIRVSGQMIQGKTDPKSSYRGSGFCPFVAKPSVSPLFAGLDRIATNRSSILEPLQPSAPLRVLAEVNGLNEKRPFAAGGDFGTRGGRILVLADHSIFINGMMLQTDNDNFAFAVRCVNWLAEREHGKRDWVLFMDEGAVVTDFHVAVKRVPDQPISPVEFADQLIAGMEQDNVFNNLLLDLFPRSRILSAWALGLTTLLIIYGLYRLARASYHADTDVPLLAGNLATLVPATPIMERRRQALLRDGNFWEAARDLARQELAAMGYDPRPSAVPAWQPQFVMNGAWAERRRLKPLVTRLWQLAYGEPIQPVSRRQFGRLLDEVNTLKKAVREGRLHLERHEGRA